MKKKNPRSEQLPIFVFILLSILLYGFAFSGTVFAIPGMSLIEPLHVLQFAWELPSRLHYIVLELLPIIVMLIGQSLLFKLQFGWSAIRWLLASLIGMLGYLVWSYLYSLIPDVIYADRLTLFTQLGLLILPVALAQYVVLHRDIKRAWLWILALIISQIFILPLGSIIYAGSSPLGRIHLEVVFWNAVFGGIHGYFIAVVISTIVRLSRKEQRLSNIQHMDLDEHRYCLQGDSSEDVEFAEDNFQHMYRKTLSLW